MRVQDIGAGSILIGIPDGQKGPTLSDGATPAHPLVSGDAAGKPIPTNDGWSSLLYNYFGDAYSAPMYADPLALKADATGLELSYQPNYRLINGSPSDPVWQGVKYEYTFNPTVHVGIDGLHASAATAADHGDWTVTAQWQSAGAGLEATFGHGLPFVYFQRTGGGDAVVDLFQDTPVNRIDSPTAQLTYTVSGLTGQYRPGDATHFFLPVDAGADAGDGTQVRISYDFNGDGGVDRTETYHYFATDAAPGWETYTDGVGTTSTGGAMANFVNGSVTMEVWNAIGDGEPEVRVDAPAGDPNVASLTPPFDHLVTASGEPAGTLYLRDGAVSGGESGALSPVPGAAATTDVMGATGGPPEWDGRGEIWHHDNNVLGVTVAGINYGIFAPPGAQWTVTDDGLRSNLAGADRFSVAVLPERSDAAIALFAAHADDAITDSQVALSHDPATGTVMQTFSVTTTTGEDPLTALYRHQWLNSDETFTNYSYESARGEMKLGVDAGFDVTYAASPMLPVLPLLDSSAQAPIRAQLDADVAAVVARPVAVPYLDTYSAGKELGRLSELVQVANQVGDTGARDSLLAIVKHELEDWFDATDGTPKLFSYNTEWNTLQGYPASFDTEKQLNDHNFHYGYFVQAAATVAMFDRQWAATSQWGGVVDQLIADVAESNPNGTLYPYLRSLDPYAGHSWASGHGAFASGNNNESSSEALNFAAAVALWGAATGRDPMRDLGIELHTVESAAVDQCWFDVDNAVFPAGYSYGAVGMIWGDGGDHRTWFSGDPEMIHGINVLPVTAAGSLHLAEHPEYILGNYNEMAAESGSAPTVWQDILWQYLALADPARALRELQANPGYTSEEGESRSHTLYWITALDQLGTLNTDVRADAPFNAVFEKNGVNTYCAYNPGSGDLSVHFTDGTSFTVPAGSMAALTGGDLKLYAMGGGATGPTPPTDPTPPGDPTNPTDPTGPGTTSDGLVLAAGVLGFDPALGAVTIASAAGVNYDGTPHGAARYTLSGVTAAYDAAKAAHFALQADAGARVGDGVQVSLAYDFNGDGTIERTETYAYFATDAAAGYETYRDTQGLKSVTGAPMASLIGGSVTVTVWNAIGNHDTHLDLAASTLDLPFQFGNSSTGHTDPTQPTEPTNPTDPPQTPTDALALVTTGAHLALQPGTANVIVPTGGGSVSFAATGLTGTLDPSAALHFGLDLDAGSGIGNATELRAFYDFDGNGAIDRTETYQYFATNDLPGWEHYSNDSGLLSAAGAMQAFQNGTIRFDLFSPFGHDPVTVKADSVSFDLPLVSGGGAPGGGGNTDPGPAAGGQTLQLQVVGGTLVTTAEAVVTACDGHEHIGTPHDPLVLTATGLYGHYDGGTAAFNLPLDAGSFIGNGTQATISFDFDGNSVVDRTETYNYFATNDVAGWEIYSQNQQLAAHSGQYADFTGGGVTVEIWNTFGSGDVHLKAGAGLVLPHDLWI
jgi:endoglucanase Acf2